MFLYRIDNWLFEAVFEPFVERFKMWTGKGGVWLASLCGCAWSLLFILFITPHVADPSASGWLLAVITEALALIMMIGHLLCMAYHARIEADELAQAQDGFLNPFRLRQKTVRELSIIIDPALIIFTLTCALVFTERAFCLLTLSVPFSFAGSYFRACTPSPPKNSRLQQRMNAVLWKIADAIGPQTTTDVR